MLDGQEQYPCGAERLHELYEQLREYTLNALDNPVQVYGLGVFLLKGMPAWIQAASHYADAQCQPNNSGREPVRLQSIDKTQL